MKMSRRLTKRAGLLLQWALVLLLLACAAQPVSAEERGAEAAGGAYAAGGTGAGGTAGAWVRSDMLELECRPGQVIQPCGRARNYSSGSGTTPATI